MRLSLACFALLSSAALGHAGTDTPPTPTVGTSQTDTRAFVGLNWTFGKGQSSAEGVLGVARVKTETDGDARGAKLSVHMPFTDGLKFGAVKLTGMSGKTDAMGEIGLGFGTGGVFGTAGLWAPYANVGVDAYFDGQLRGYVGFHTLRKWDRPAATAVIEEF